MLLLFSCIKVHGLIPVQMPTISLKILKIKKFTPTCIKKVFLNRYSN